MEVLESDVPLARLRRPPVPGARGPAHARRGGARAGGDHRRARPHVGLLPDGPGQPGPRDGARRLPARSDERRQPGREWFCYEDHGYKHIPGLLAWRVAKLLRSQPWPTPAIVPHVPDEERKRRAIWCYTSQIPPLERDHALTRPRGGPGARAVLAPGPAARRVGRPGRLRRSHWPASAPARRPARESTGGPSPGRRPQCVGSDVGPRVLTPSRRSGHGGLRRHLGDLDDLLLNAARAPAPGPPRCRPRVPGWRRLHRRRASRRRPPSRPGRCTGTGSPARAAPGRSCRRSAPAGTARRPQASTTCWALSSPIFLRYTGAATVIR